MKIEKDESVKQIVLRLLSQNSFKNIKEENFKVKNATQFFYHFSILFVISLFLNLTIQKFHFHKVYIYNFTVCIFLMNIMIKILAKTSPP